MTKRRQRNYDPTRTEHTPLNVQRSGWRPLGFGIPMPDRPGELIPGYKRNVNDGTLRAFAADEPSIGWHMSISFVNHRGEATRYPTWDEMMHARLQLLPLDLSFVIRFPASTEGYVAMHLTTFHLHEERPERRIGDTAARRAFDAQMGPLEDINRRATGQ